MKKPLMMLLLLLSLTLPIANAEEPQYVRMPCHLVDLWWDIGQDVPFESYSIDVTISEEIARLDQSLHRARRFGAFEQDCVLRWHPDSGGWQHQERSQASQARSRLPDVDVGRTELGCHSSL